GVEATRRVHLDDQGIRPVCDGLVHGVGYVVVSDRVDDAVEGGHQDVWLSGAGWNRWHQGGHHDGREKEPNGPLHDLIIAPVQSPPVRRMRRWPNALSSDRRTASKRTTGRRSRA